MIWNLESGLAFCRQLEVAAKGHFHFALAGSVMYTGQSNKDLDIICYPHGNLFHVEDEAVLVRTLESQGVQRVSSSSSFTKLPADGYRTVWKLVHQTRPIDLFLFS